MHLLQFWKVALFFTSSNKKRCNKESVAKLSIHVSHIFDCFIKDPSTFCETVGLCTVPGKVAIVPVVKVEPASMVGNGYVKDTVECTLCKYLMQEVDNVLKQNETVVRIDSDCNVVEIISFSCLRLFWTTFSNIFENILWTYI